MNAQLGEPLTHVDGGLEGLALNDTSDESTGERITSAVGVVDLVLADSVDCDRLYVYAATLSCADGNGGVCALCDDDCSATLGVLLGTLGDGLRNGFDVLGLDVVRLGECSSLGLVSNEDVNVWEDLVERVLEELGNERCGEVKNKDLRILVWPGV